MSRLSPHIQALRAEAAALTAQATKMGKPGISEVIVAQTMLLAMSSAKLDAADQLEEWERKQMEGTHG